MKIIFACDLDNTAIYSHKHKQPNDICVEMLNGKEQSFMSPKACSLLKQVSEKVEFVPVTTRSIEQYNRIDWTKSIKPNYAVTTNGAILFNNSVSDENWKEISREYSRPYYSEMESLKSYLEKQSIVLRCRIVDDMYLFAYCEENTDADKYINEYSAITNLEVAATGRKMYFFPKGINKGYAVLRLKEKLKADILICAGDSKIDIPMLEAADYSLVPSQDLLKQIKNKRTTVCSGHFSEELMQYILDLKL